MTSERLFNSFIHPQQLLYPPKQISGYAPDTNLQESGMVGLFHWSSKQENITKQADRRLDLRT